MTDVIVLDRVTFSVKNENNRWGERRTWNLLQSKNTGRKVFFETYGYKRDKFYGWSVVGANGFAEKLRERIAKCGINGNKEDVKIVMLARIQCLSPSIAFQEAISCGANTLADFITVGDHSIAVFKDQRVNDLCAYLPLLSTCDSSLFTEEQYANHYSAVLTGLGVNLKWVEAETLNMECAVEIWEEDHPPAPEPQIARPANWGAW